MVCPWCNQEVIGPYWEHLAFDPPKGCQQVSMALGKAKPRRDARSKQAAVPVKKKAKKK